MFLELGLGILCHDDPVGVGRPGAVVVSISCSGGIGVGVVHPGGDVIGVGPEGDDGFTAAAAVVGNFHRKVDSGRMEVVEFSLASLV